MANTIGTAYVQIIPSAQGIKGSIEGIMKGEADSAGTSSGKAFSGKFGGALKATGAKIAKIGAGMTAAGAGLSVLGHKYIISTHAPRVRRDNDGKRISESVPISTHAPRVRRDFSTR